MLYQPVKRFLNFYCIPKLHMKVTYLKGTDLNEMEAAIRKDTALIILESPATFIYTRCVVDLRGDCGISRTPSGENIYRQYILHAIISKAARLRN